MLNRFFMFVNGINADVEDHVHNWHSRAERWVEKRGLGFADTHNYSMLPAQRWRKQQDVIDALYECLKDRGTYERLVLVGHSNGCVVLTELLKQHGDILCHHLHLIAGACEASFEKNGLNTGIESGQIGRVTIYHSHADRALKLAWYTRWIPFLGYGSLGWKGPTKMGEQAKLITHVEDCTPMDHSDYFDAQHFDRVMEMVTQ